MAQKSAELAAAGVDVISLAVGEPDFPTPGHIAEAAHEAIDAGWTKYSPVGGYLSIREAICGKLLRENGLRYKPSQIVVSNGAKQCICNAVMALVSPGDEVIIPAPYWVSYPQMVRLAGGVPVHPFCGIEAGFKLTASQLEEAIGPRSRLIILCSPSNPTGAVYSASELAALAEVVLRHKDLMVISDEIYEHVNYTGTIASIAAVPGMEERCVVVNGVSKAYAMTGWRIGFAASPQWLTDACNMLQGQYSSGPSSISQKAAEVAWNGSQECVEQMRAAFRRRRDLLVGLLREIPGLEVPEPDGTFYLFPCVKAFLGLSFNGRRVETTEDLAMYLLEEAHVATVAGDAFGAPGYLRLSFSTSEDKLQEAARRIASALSTE